MYRKTQMSHNAFYYFTAELEAIPTKPVGKCLLILYPTNIIDKLIPINIQAGTLIYKSFRLFLNFKSIKKLSKNKNWIFETLLVYLIIKSK